MENSSILSFIESNKLPLKASAGKGLTFLFHQRNYNISYPIAIADLLTIFHKLITKKKLSPVSPQPLIDFTDSQNLSEMLKYVDDFGVHTLCTYPFIMMKRSDPRRPTGYPVYKFPYSFTVTQPKEIQESIVKSVAMGSFGGKFPVLGEIHVESIRDWRKWSPDKPPYSPSPLPGNYAVIVTGYDFTSPDPADHFWEVKNCYSEKWGEGGYGRIAVNGITRIVVPALGGE